MGAEAYCYKTPYEDDPSLALHNAREALLDQGELPSLEFDMDDEEAAEMAEAGGMGGTLLDITEIGSSPDFGVAAPVTDAEILELFGTDKPTEAQIEKNHDIYNHVNRGECRFLTMYDDEGQPKYIYFFGLSVD